MKCDIIDHAYFNYRSIIPLLSTIENLELKVANLNLEKKLQPQDKLHPSVSVRAQLSSNPPLIEEPRKHILGESKWNKNGNSSFDAISSLNTDELQCDCFANSTGLNFSGILVQQLQLGISNELNLSNLDNFNQFDHLITKPHTPLPPYKIAATAISNYINYVHIYYPILEIKTLKPILDSMYNATPKVLAHEKFIFFIVLSIGLDRSKKNCEIGSYINRSTILEYYNNASIYLESVLSDGSEKSLQCSLLNLMWCLTTNLFEANIAVMWHLSRFSMSLAIELGIHRNNDSQFSALQRELRNRLFWCSSLIERIVALQFDRGLKLLDQDTNIQLPQLINNDIFLNNEWEPFDALATYNKVHIRPYLFLINIHQIYFDILKYFYKPPDFNSLSLEESYIEKTRLQNLLADYFLQLDREIPTSFDCYYKLKIRHSVGSIILNRPSPVLSNPDTVSIVRCKTHCQISVEAYCSLLNNRWEVNSICLHDMIVVGLTMLYCCWKTELDTRLLESFSEKSLRIMNEIVRCCPEFVKFKSLYLITSSIIIDGFRDSVTSTEDNTISVQDEFNLKNVNFELQTLKDGIQYLSSFNKNKKIIGNGTFNDWFIGELFQDIFCQYSQDKNVFWHDLKQLFNQ